MLRVYLDQNHWISLARARHHNRRGADFEDAWLVAQESVRTGRASFVLSATHYYETQRRRDFGSRERLALTMIELSRLHTIAPASIVVPGEIDSALYEVTGRAGNPPSPTQVFGVGYGHAFGTDDYRYRLPDAYDPPVGWRSRLEEWGTDFVESRLLVGPRPGETDPLRDIQARLRDFDRQFAEGQQQLAERLAAHGYNKGDRLAAAMSATGMVDILDPLNEVAAQRGIDLVSLFDSREVADSFMEQLPSRWIERGLRLHRHRNPQQRWAVNDLADVVALSIAVPYCDVVVTERQWARALGTSDLAGRYGTTVLGDLRDLPSALVT